MSAFTAAYVRRGPWEMRPVLLLLLLASLAGTVSGQLEDEEDVNEEHPYLPEDDANPSEYEEVTATDPSLLASGESEVDEGLNPDLTTPDYYMINNTTDTNSTEETFEEGLSFTIILVPVVLVVVIIGMIVCGITMSRKWNQKMTTSDRINDSYLQASSTEKVPMPMFDDDIPSVLELEMEDMDQWVENNA